MSKPNDMLARIFSMQTDLNDYVFNKNNMTDNGGQTLSMHSIFKAVEEGDVAVNQLPNQWLAHYSKAMKEELLELDAELLWKWWSKDTINLQNIRVELIDILHFLVSAMICAGLTPDKVFDIYQQKHQVNLNRQNTGYNQASKTEEDNKNIS